MITSFIIGAFVATEAASVNLAYTLQIVPYVIAIKRLSIIFVVIYGTMVFSEHEITKRLAGAATDGYGCNNYYGVFIRRIFYPVKMGTWVFSKTSNIPWSVILRDGITGRARNERYIKGLSMLPIVSVTV